MADIFEQSITEKSMSGVRMPLCFANSDEVITHQAKDDPQPREMYLVLLGPESPQVKRAVAKLQHRMDRKKKNHIPSDEEVERERQADSKLLAELTVGGLIYGKKVGGWLDITPENAYDLYYEALPVRSQALTFIFDTANFTKG